MEKVGDDWLVAGMSTDRGLEAAGPAGRRPQVTAGA